LIPHWRARNQYLHHVGSGLAKLEAACKFRLAKNHAFVDRTNELRLRL